ncbi:type II secretion system protein J [Herminiimonas sp. CN]|uniref:PulJ/GspJ family protein n=1 Tax=Herminiimonas sp. CN TaxID=1349818 RepID=UPI000473D95B|nr:prepilin-type N-terminal cleavage/methylation domain-containing protein [Herminiimonas sp. CN]
MAYKRSHRGFTLIELLVAIGILAIVAVLGWRGLDGIVRARVALTAELEQTRGLQLAFAQLQSDTEHLASRADIGGRATLAAQDGRLTLIRSVFADDQPSRLQVVAYRIRDGVLIRRESLATRDLAALDALWQASIGGTDADSPAVALQSAISGLTLQLWFDDDAGWRADAGSAANTANPSGLEVVLQGGPELRMTKVFLLGAS